MNRFFPLIAAACVAWLASSSPALPAQSVAAERDESAATRLFAVEITVGPHWDDELAPGDQAFFREHSANLRRLRDAGHIVMGARYSDKGLIIFSAPSENDVRAMMDVDPSMEAGTFVYEVFAFNVFFPGSVGTDTGD